MSTASWYPLKIVRDAIVGGDRNSRRPQQEANGTEDLMASNVGHCQRNAVEFKRSDKEWVMLCLPRADTDERYALHQVDFEEPPVNNAAFFKRLQTVYKDIRTPTSRWRLSSWLRQVKVTEIHFVKFETGNTEPTHQIRVLAKPNLPSGEEGWLCNLIRATTVAPIEPKEMAESFRLDVTEEGQQMYGLVPRKLGEALPRQSGVYGWGLYVVEAPRWHPWTRRLVILAVVCLALGIRIAASVKLGLSTGVGLSCAMIGVTGIMVSIW